MHEGLKIGILACVIASAGAVSTFAMGDVSVSYRCEAEESSRSALEVVRQSADCRLKTAMGGYFDAKAASSVACTVRPARRELDLTWSLEPSLAFRPAREFAAEIGGRLRWKGHRIPFEEMQGIQTGSVGVRESAHGTLRLGLRHSPVRDISYGLEAQGAVDAKLGSAIDPFEFDATHEYSVTAVVEPRWGCFHLRLHLKGSLSAPVGMAETKLSSGDSCCDYTYAVGVRVQYRP